MAEQVTAANVRSASLAAAQATNSTMSATASYATHQVISDPHKPMSRVAPIGTRRTNFSIEPGPFPFLGSDGCLKRVEQTLESVRFDVKL